MRASQIFALFAGALAMALLPCAPALGATDSCRMPGCVSAPSTRVGPADCCCAASNAPALTGTPATVVDPSGKNAPVAPLLQHDLVPSHAFVAWEVAIDPPLHVPLFLLDSALLI